jgi:5-methylcytosine-specific restriction endonuclease McrA
VNSKSGLFFCCRKHKDEAQRLGGIKEIQPSHYGTASSISSYRERALRELPNECKNCGYKTYPEILEVNHIDCDRSNNDITNLEILCPTCHSEYHFTTRTGCWSKRE